MDGNDDNCGKGTVTNYIGKKIGPVIINDDEEDNNDGDDENDSTIITGGYSGKM